MKKTILILVLFSAISFIYGEIKVIGTTTVIYDLVKEIGKEKVKADYICRADQDPHFVEVLPTYMLKLKGADVLFKIGMGLENWLPQLIDGARNSKLRVVDLSANITKKEVPQGKTDASMGDVHPQGNPHYWLDPENAKIMADEIVSALSQADPANKNYYEQNYKFWLGKLNSKLKEWQNVMSVKKGKQIITFHSSWVYFCERYGIKVAGYVEPKPGIPPSPSHNAELVNLVKNNRIKMILMENYYSDAAPNQIARITGARVVKTEIGVMSGTNASYFNMMDMIVNAFSQL